jgi:hypothetical protein
VGGDRVKTYTITDSQFDKTDTDSPDMQLIIEALQDVETELNSETVWVHKGNYQLCFWIDDENPNQVFCNVFILSEPDNPNNSDTLDYSYYFEIEVTT